MNWSSPASSDWTDDACRHWLWRTLYSADGSTSYCPSCETKRTFHRLRGRSAYSCSACGHQIAPTAGTIFHKSKTSLALWFRAVALAADSDRRVTARELAQTLGVSYRTARRMLGIIRSELARRDREANRTGVDDPAGSPGASARSGSDRDLFGLILDESRSPEPSWAQRATGRSAPSERQGSPSRFASVRDATRERILAATCRAIVAKGMAAVRVSDIARDAGLSTATVHYYFETRDDVLFAAAKWHNLRETLRRAEIVESNLSPVAKLLSFLEASMPPNGFGRDEALIRYNLWGRAMRDAPYQRDPPAPARGVAESGGGDSQRGSSLGRLSHRSVV